MEDISLNIRYSMYILCSKNKTNLMFGIKIFADVKVSLTRTGLTH